jgi:hypothetical protein
MERLTVKKKNREIFKYDSKRAYGVICDRLGAYEDKIEQGKMIEQLAKINGPIWLLLERNDGKPAEIKESVVWGIYFNRGNVLVYSCYFKCPEIDNSLEYRAEDFGKTVFLTHEAAEAALKEALHDKA